MSRLSVSNTSSGFTYLLATGLTAGVLFAGASGVSGQEGPGIRFDTDLPRTLIFIAEEGAGQTASNDFGAFFREAGFPLIDPALAHTVGQRELVQRALEGDEGAATELGRAFGAQLLVIGRADWGSRPDPVNGAAMTGTSEVNVRALRMDDGRVVATARGEGRQLEATEQAARTGAIRQAATRILQQTSFVGQLMNDWTSRSWTETGGYWAPDPGSIPEEVGSGTEGGAPGLAILRADVGPSTQGQTRGLGVVQRGDRSSSLFNPVRLEGVVSGNARSVEVEGQPAILQPLLEEEARRLGLEGIPAQRFMSELSLPMSRDTVRVRATGQDGSEVEAIAAPRINNRYAVVIGIGQYQAEDIPDLAYARADAQAVYDFLTSSAAGPFEPENVLFLADEEATGAAMREALFVFLQQARWDDLVVIYYAGHGAPDPNRPDNLYLLPHDGDINSMAASGFPMWDVKTALRRQIQAERVIVIADACHSGGTRGEAIPDENPIAGAFSELFTPSRRLTMTAADSHEFSLEDARWGGHGVFTYYLLDGLRGAGDADGDGIVTFSEAFDFVSGRVREETGGRQNPQRAGMGDIPLSVVGGSAAASGSSF